MNASDSYSSRSNPFSTRFTRPGRLDYVFPAGQSLEGIFRRLADSAWHGQIIGPHGSGKSSLLTQLGPLLAASGRTIWAVRLRDRQRSLPSGWIQDALGMGADQLVIDGYEQLSAWQRLLVRWRCRRRGWGLLVTAHADVGFPTLLTTHADLETTGAIIAQLTAGLPPISEATIAEHFQAAGGNLRETLFRLYDVWERDPALRTDPPPHNR